MSKVSEWAKAARKLPIAPGFGSLAHIVLVNNEPCLQIMPSNPLAKETAVGLARWIIDTFGDAP